MASNIQFCDIVKNNQGSICLEGVQTFFALDFIPGVFSFGLTVMISGYDWNIPHRIHLELRDLDDITLLAIDEVSPVPKFDEQVPAKFRSLIGAWQLMNVKVQSEGVYRVRLYVDSVLDREQEFYILQRKTADNQ